MPREASGAGLHLVDHVFPEAPVRQFVLTFPFPLRFLFAAQPDALTQVLAVVQSGISTFLIHHAGLRVSAGARTRGSAHRQGFLRFAQTVPIAIRHALFGTLRGLLALRANRPLRLAGATHVVLEPLGGIVLLYQS